MSSSVQSRSFSACSTCSTLLVRRTGRPTSTWPWLSESRGRNGCALRKVLPLHSPNSWQRTRVGCRTYGAVSIDQTQPCLRPSTSEPTPQSAPRPRPRAR
eukprot:88511-Pleurochrysis_carterae.AAC.6